MPAKTISISENSRSSFQGMLDKWIYPALGELKLPDITPANITALLLSMQAQGKAHATVVKCYTIRAFRRIFIKTRRIRTYSQKLSFPAAMRSVIMAIFSPVRITKGLKNGSRK